MKGIVPTPEQQAILDLGPTTIRVRAGAGTGKTTTLALVIANLITNHGLELEQVLGITFTNKAAAELAERVRQSLPETIDQARQVEVHTYHGFAAQILAEFGALVDVDNRSKVITPTFARQLLRDRVRSRSYQHLDITLTQTIDKIRRLGDRLGDHLLRPDDVIAAGRDSDDETWLARKEMAQALDQYNEDKARLRLVDYADLVTLAHRVVSRFPDLAATIRSRYAVVVLDEYQDTNPAQRFLLIEIFGDGLPVIAVGDEDQTIYEWRGASAENFIGFPGHFTTPDGKAAHDQTLQMNRRSSNEILEVANQARRMANPAGNPLKPLETAGRGEVLTFWASDAIEEAEWIARHFEELHAQGSRWRDMAVLFRKNKDFSPVVEAMSRHDIPIEVANIGGLLSVPEVAELRAWLTILERPEDSPSLTQILFGSRYRLGMADLAPLARWAALHTPEPTGDEDDPPAVSLIEAIETANTIEGIREPARRALTRFHEAYRHLLTETQGTNLVETCRMILDRLRVWQDIEALPVNSRLTARLNIHRMLDLTEDWSPLQGGPSLGAFLDYMDEMEQEPAEELDSAHLSGEDAVTLVTVHRAKGLEWETVAIPAVTKTNFPSSPQQHPDPVRFPEHLPPDMRIDSTIADLPMEDEKERTEYLRARHLAQEWRVAYVALTRAKRRLLVSGAFWYGLPEPTKHPKQPSELFELVEANAVSRSDGKAERKERPGLLRSVPVSDGPDPYFPKGWSHGVRAEIDQPGWLDRLAEEMGVKPAYEKTVEQITEQLFSLATPAETPQPDEERTVSVTGLVTYARCPKSFFWTEVDPLPRRHNPAASRGSELHRRIELHQRGQVPFEQLTDQLYDDVGEGGGSQAGGYKAYEESRFSQEKALLVEVPFTMEVGTGYRVRGRIDAVYSRDDHWEVVDFKSGRRSDEPSRLVQLQAYAVAVRDADLGVPAPDRIDVTFAYLGGGLDEESFVVDKEWETKARAKLDSLTGAIGDSVFPATPGPWCNGCDFLQFCPPGQAEVGRLPK